jgi:hypothetical protein
MHGGTSITKTNIFLSAFIGVHRRFQSFHFQNLPAGANSPV